MEKADLKGMAALAERAARAAAGLLREGFGSADVLAQQGRDIKLGQDHRAQAVIIEALRASDIPVLAEEDSGGLAERPEGLHWVVDPLDGSFNYKMGVPMCCTSIALAEGSEPLLGCVHDFVRGEMMVGVIGEGLTLDGRAVAPGGASSGVLATGFPVGGDFSDSGMTEVIGELRQWKKVRMIGSAALALAWTAIGRFDAYVERGTRWWDVAGGLALVAAGGGRIEIHDRGEGLYDVRALRDGNDGR